MNYKNVGIIRKYNIQHTTGNSVDPNGDYFVLKLNSKDKKHRDACIAAIIIYAYKIKDHLPKLSKELIEKYGQKIRPCEIISETCNDCKNIEDCLNNVVSI